jgi:L-ascorbate metabolism protein UlaG (beta-lactamase superfamily)
MEIEYKGATALTIKTNGAMVVIDPKLESFGLKNTKTSDAIEVVTDKRFAIDSDSEKLLISGPGEYEVSDISIKGVAAKRHIDGDGKNSTMYRIVVGGYRIAVIGNISENLSEDQLEELGIIDIAIVPVGGGGYTLDAHGAAKVVKALDPKVIIPVNYADKGIKYEVPQAELEPFIKELGAVQHNTAEKLKLKAGGILAETLSLLELKRT